MRTILFLFALAAAFLAMSAQAPVAQAKPDFFTSQNCSLCHYDDAATCAGCHAHGVHSQIGGNNINLSATTDKGTYAPGEAMAISVTGGNRSGWARVIVYDQNGVEAARSTGPGGTGSGESLPGPIVLAASAPQAPGTYTYSASWYGNAYDKSSAAFVNWVADPGNPGHGEEIIETNTFTVEGPPAAAGASPGLFRDGFWFIDLDCNGLWDGQPTDMKLKFGGQPGDIPVIGDWDGTGTVRAGIFRDGDWYLDLNGNGQWDGQPTDMKFRFGQPGDMPVVGDWDGTGTARAGIFRDGYWYLDLNGNGQWDGQPTDMGFKYGRGGDTPVIGDWDGTGIQRAGVFRDGYWYLDLNGNGQWDGQPADMKLKFGGQPGDMPVVGDWDGTGIQRAGVFRDGFWYLDLNGNGQWDGQPGDMKFRYGRGGDTPIVGLW
ncbi:MAG: hypothetical protein Kow0025_16800 [Thermodesulfovibrionales bacterium]